MRVSVFGLGYVGCVTGACLARSGHEVVGVDVSAEKVAMINSGRPTVLEPGLDEVVARAVSHGRLRATLGAADAVASTDLALVCVGTPGLPNGRLDVAALDRACREIGDALRDRAAAFTVVIRSTVLPGTMETVVVPGLVSGTLGWSETLVLPAMISTGLLSSRDLPFAAPVRVAVNPEFMREGSSLRDFSRPPMTLVGCEDPQTAEQLRALYGGVEAPFVQASIRAAEMAKYVVNAFHALKVCFANEVGDVCAALGADPLEVTRLFLMDRKLSLSEAYLQPGFAFGGSCLPKDVRALLYGARGADLMPPLLSAILPSNEQQIRRGVEAVLAARKRRVGLVGLAFKEGTDDLRESPLVALVEALTGKGCDVRILDHNVTVSRLVGANRRYVEEQLPHVASLMCDSVAALLAHAEVLVIGSGGPDAARVLAAAGPEHRIVDLTRGSLRRLQLPGAAA